MKTANSIDTIIGFCTLLIAGLVWMVSREIPFQELKAGLGPAFFPNLLIAILVVLGIIFLIVSFLTKKSVETSSVEKPKISTIVIVGLLVIYAVLFKRIGFLISTFLFLVSSMFALKVQWLHAIIISILVTGGFYLIFIISFKMPLI